MSRPARCHPFCTFAGPDARAVGVDPAVVLLASWLALGLSLGCGGPSLSELGAPQLAGAPAAATAPGVASQQGGGTPAAEPNRGAAPPQPPFSLRSFGARGDGESDDTVFIQEAFTRSQGDCLDGEGLKYRVYGNLRAQKKLCLRNATLVQGMDPFDERPFINSDSKPPVSLTAGARIYHEEDPQFSEAEHAEAIKRYVLRTIYVEADVNDTDSFVTLQDVTVNKGLYPSLGNGGDSAAIMVYGAARVDFDNVEVYGQGQGYAIYIRDSHNITLSRVSIHDILWQPIVGRRSIVELVSMFGWNSVPLYEYDVHRRKFREVRSQEAASGLVLADNKNVSVKDSRVSEINVRVGDKLVPWQADGITFANCEDVVVQDTRLAQTWEGIDFSGAFNRNVKVVRVHATDSFAFGLKFAHQLSGAFLMDNRVERSGISGIVFSGAEEEKQHDVIIANSEVYQTGGLVLKTGQSLIRPWGQSATAALDIRGRNDRDKGPEHFRIVNFLASNSSDHYPGKIYPMDFGIRADTGEYVHIANYNTTVIGQRIEGSRINSYQPLYTPATVINSYRNIAGCTPDFLEMIYLWDQSHGSVRYPPWGPEDLEVEIARRRDQHQVKCL